MFSVFLVGEIHNWLNGIKKALKSNVLRVFLIVFVYGNYFLINFNYLVNIHRIR